VRTKHLDAAIARLKATLEIQSMETKALNDLSVAFMPSGRAAEGLDTFQRATDLEAGNPQYRKKLGQALQKQGRTDNARSHLTS